MAQLWQVLASDPKNAKAMFRRGKAQLRLCNTDGAAADLDAVQRLAPDDAGIARELKACSVMLGRSLRLRVGRVMWPADPDPLPRLTYTAVGMLRLSSGSCT